MKYQLIKTYPNSEELYTITVDPENTLKDFPEFYAPLGERIFQTFDGEDVYDKQNVAWVISNRYSYMLNFCPIHATLLSENPDTYKVFTSEAKALDYVASIPKPFLFVTEDGHNIFGGEQIYCVSESLDLFQTGVLGAEETDKNKRTFLQRENAEKYISRNLKKYSWVDIKTALRSVKNLEESCINNVMQNLCQKETK